MQYSNHHYMLAIRAVLQERGMKSVGFTPSTFGDPDDIPTWGRSVGSVKPIASVELSDDGIVIVAESKRPGWAFTFNCTGNEDEDYKTLFEDVYHWNNKADDPEPEEWLEEHFLQIPLEAHFAQGVIFDGVTGGSALIVPPTSPFPESVLNHRSKVLHLAIVSLTNPDYMDSDPNANGVLYDLHKEDEEGLESMWLVSDFELPDGVSRVKVLNNRNDYSERVLKHFNRLLLVEEILDDDFLRVTTEQGIKMIEPRFSYYYAGELEAGDGKPYRRVEYWNAKVPLSEYLQNRDMEGWYDELLECSRQAVQELSAEDFAREAASELRSARRLSDGLTLESPDGIYI